MSDQRTIQQNKSFHKYCTQLADALSDSGQDMRAVLKPDIDIPWSMENVKECMVKPIIKAMFNLEHTADLDTKQMTQMYEVLNRHTASRLGISVDWPSLESQDKQ